MQELPYIQGKGKKQRIKGYLKWISSTDVPPSTLEN